MPAIADVWSRATGAVALLPVFRSVQNAVAEAHDGPQPILHKREMSPEALKALGIVISVFFVLGLLSLICCGRLVVQQKRRRDVVVHTHTCSHETCIHERPLEDLQPPPPAYVAREGDPPSKNIV